MSIFMFVFCIRLNKMKTDTRQAYLLFAVALGIAHPVFAVAPGESIVKDARTGDYTITYCGLGPIGAKDTCVLRRVVFVPATKIDPRVKSLLKFDQKWNIQYRYVITNGATSAQTLIDFALDPVTDIKSQIPLSKKWGVRTEAQMMAETNAGRQALATPVAWRGDVLPSDEGGLRIVWMHNDSEGIRTGLQPGRSQNGFEFSSLDLPGIGVSEFSGNSGLGLGFEDEGPDGDISEQLHQLQMNDFVRRYAAVPAISIANPFNAAVILQGIQKQTKAWVDLQLLDPALSSQFDRVFQAAIDAASRNDSKRVNAYLTDIRKLVRNEHKDLESDRDDDKDDAAKKGSALIAKLAAQVLNFNLKYIRKRLGSDDD